MMALMLAGSATPPATLPEQNPNFRERVGGRWVISWQVYTLGAVTNTALLALTGGSLGAEPVDAPDVPWWLVSGIFASSCVGIYALVANATVFRHKREQPSPLWLVVAFHAGVGLIFGSAILVAAQAMDLPRPTPALTFLLATGGIAVWWGLTMALLFEARERFRIRRQVLLDRVVDLEWADLVEDEMLQELQERVNRQVADALDASRVGLLPQLVERDDVGPRRWIEAADALRQTAADSVRPLSHRLWSQAQVSFPEPKSLDVLARTAQAPTPAPVAAGVIVVIGYFRAGQQALGGVGGLLAVALLAAAVAALLAGSRFIQVRLPRIRSAAFWGCFFAAEMLGLAFIVLTADRVTVIDIAGSIVAMAVSVLAPTIVASLNDARFETLEAIERTSDLALAKRVARERSVAQFARTSAQRLHGSVQSSLIACAAAMDQAASDDDPRAFSHAAERAIQVLERGAVESAPSESAPSESGGLGSTESPFVSLVHAIDSAAAPWAGLVDVTVRVSQQDSHMVPAEVATNVTTVVEECIANSVRHGQAGAVVIDVQTINGGEARTAARVVELLIADDGVGLSTQQVRDGLGSHLLRVHASAGVTRTSVPSGGCLVRALIPVVDPPDVPG